MKKKKFKVLIIGCGNIAGNLDSQVIKKKNSITHAGAYKNNKNFILAACIEPNKKKRLKFIKKWKIKYGFKNISDFLKFNLTIDVVSICSPTNLHFQNLIDSFKIKPKIIFCEKPLTESISNSKKIIRMNRTNKIKILVNYSRRFDETVLKFKKEIKSGVFGKLRSINGVYNKGILNNGSHLLDLLIFLIGKLKIKYAADPIFDYKQEDPSIPFFLRSYSGVPIQVSCGNAFDYSFFEIQFVFSKVLIILEKNGLKWRIRRPISSKFFSKYKELSDGYFFDGNYMHSMNNAIKFIQNLLNYKKNILISTPKTSLESQIICENIKRLSFKNYKY